MNTDVYDFYIFTHGHDYRGALSDFVKVIFFCHLSRKRLSHWTSPPTPFSTSLLFRLPCQVGGKIAMVPRYITGLWFTRWYDLNNIDVKKIVSEYRNRALPLDVFVLDMNWHTKYHVSCAAYQSPTAFRSRLPALVYARLLSPSLFLCSGAATPPILICSLSQTTRSCG